jgi:peptidylprolyl isomerase domain and WD repeat-containing protein 1
MIQKATAEEEEEEKFIPIYKKHKSTSLLQLSDLPCSNQYEKSYSHPGIVCHLVVTPNTQFVISGDSLGHLKFWKKSEKGIEFVKRYKPHNDSVVGISCSQDGLNLASIGQDGFLRFYDIVGFDMLESVKLGFTPSCCAFVHSKYSPFPILAVGDQASGKIRMYKVGKSEPVQVITDMHFDSVQIIRYNAVFNAVVSVDRACQVEVWQVPDVFEGNEEIEEAPLPEGLSFKLKAETDLFEFAKARKEYQKLRITWVEISPDGLKFATQSTDMQVRVFDFKTCKKIIQVDESAKNYEIKQAIEDPEFHIDAIDFGRRLVSEKALVLALEADHFCQQVPPNNVIFDSTERLLIYPTMMGIKILDLETLETASLLGRNERNQRFLNVQLFQGALMKIGGSAAAAYSIEKFLAQKDDEANPSLKEMPNDPTFFCSSLKNSRFFLFSRREPDEKYALTIFQYYSNTYNFCLGLYEMFIMSVRLRKMFVL